MLSAEPGPVPLEVLLSGFVPGPLSKAGRPARLTWLNPGKGYFSFTSIRVVAFFRGKGY